MTDEAHSPTDKGRRRKRGGRRNRGRGGGGGDHPDDDDDEELSPTTAQSPESPRGFPTSLMHLVGGGGLPMPQLPSSLPPVETAALLAGEHAPHAVGLFFI